MKRRRVAVGCLTLALLTACLLSLALFGLAQVWLPEAGLPLGYRIVACVSVATGRHWVQFGWILPEMRSSLGPWPPGCVWLPWLPILPGSGSLNFPP
jgi:hypothetical protein